MGLTIWSALGGGKFKTEEELAARQKSGEVWRVGVARGVLIVYHSKEGH